MQCKVYLKGYTPGDLAEALKKEPALHNADFDWEDINVSVTTGSGGRRRAFSPEVATLIVGGISAVVPLLVEILKYCINQNRGARSTVIVKDKCGTTIVIHSDTASDKTGPLVEAVHSMDQPRITVIRNDKRR